MFMTALSLAISSSQFSNLPTFPSLSLDSSTESIFSLTDFTKKLSNICLAISDFSDSEILFFVELALISEKFSSSLFFSAMLPSDKELCSSETFELESLASI
ncbi:hypothetical protein V8G54_003514 [Vigna mungo]|uniref:Uncharacterized protein n=1 Tax=Vigna mungo TaxID=3915 RepID=A0AAQ3PC88_VIGMU